MSSLTSTTKKLSHERHIFQPRALSRGRADIIQSSMTDRKGAHIADDITLVQHYLRVKTVDSYAALVLEKQSVPPRAKQLVSAALLWNVGTHTCDDLLIVPASAVDDLTAPAMFVLLNVIVEPNDESRRCYQSTVIGVPLVALSDIGTYGNTKPITTNQPFGKKRATDARPPMPALSGEQQTRFDTLSSALPDSAAAIYGALAEQNQMTLELLLMAAERSTLDPLTRWRLATVVSNAYHVTMRACGYARTDFIRVCAQPVLVRGVKHYFVDRACLAACIDDVLWPPAALRCLAEFAPPDDTPVAAGTLRVGGVAIDSATHANDDDAVFISSDDESIGDVAPRRQVAPLLPPPAAPLGLITDTYRAPHILDLLRTELHMDTAGEDEADIEEVEGAAKHRMRTLFTIFDIALGESGGCDREALMRDSKISRDDLAVAEWYPYGYAAVARATYPGAPGLRSRARAASYAALGLGVLCIVVRQRPQLLEWLFYVETLLMGAKQRHVDRTRHLDGISRFVAHTAEPDVDDENLLARLVAELRDSIEKKLAPGWRRRLGLEKADEENGASTSDSEHEVAPPPVAPPRIVEDEEVIEL